MANLDFPLNPTIGQVYSVGNKSWQWTGVAWAIQRATVTGKSAYEHAIENGFVGTEAAWLASLKGPKGDTGEQGPIGLPGLRGEKGDAGDRGADGINGVNGTNGVGVPTGGAAGMILAKASGDPYDTTWITPDFVSDYTVPLGGNQGQFLGKESAANGDFAWLDLPTSQPYDPELPLGGSQGQVLTKASATSGDVVWSDPVGGSGIPDGGTAGQVLAKNSQFNGDASWVDPTGGIEEAPLDSQKYVRQDGSWVIESTGSGSANYPSFANNQGKFLRVNSTANGVEWASIASASLATWSPVTAVGTGVSQNITLPEPVINDYEIEIYVNGIHQPVSQYSVSGTTVTLTTNAAGDSIEIRSAGGGSNGTELPSLTGNANRVLAVTADETGTEWVEQTTNGSSDPYYRMAGFFTTSPAVNEILMIYVADVPITFDSNFAGSQARLIGMQPTSDFALSIRKNSSTEIGTLTVNTAGVASFSTTDGTPKTLAVGDAVSIHAPGLADSISNLTWILRGNK